MRKFATSSTLFWPVVIQHLKLKTSPTAMLWRLQGAAVLMTTVLLFLLPLALLVRLALLGLLGLVVVGLVLQSRHKPEFKSLTIDTEAQTVSIDYSSPESVSGEGIEQKLQQERATTVKPLGCRVEYFSQSLIMLAYSQEVEDDVQCRYLRRSGRLPVFPSMLSNDDYRRLLAVVSIVKTQ